MRSLFKPIFDRYHVNAYICGHEHSLQHIKPEGFTNYFISGAGSETTPAFLHPEGRQICKDGKWFYGFHSNGNRDKCRCDQLFGRKTLLHNYFTQLIFERFSFYTFHKIGR